MFKAEKNAFTLGILSHAVCNFVQAWNTFIPLNYLPTTQDCSLDYTDNLFHPDNTFKIFPLWAILESNFLNKMHVPQPMLCII